MRASSSVIRRECPPRRCSQRFPWGVHDTGLNPLRLFNREPQSEGLVEHPSVPIFIRCERSPCGPGLVRLRLAQRKPLPSRGSST